jgi:hypothetical protein
VNGTTLRGFRHRAAFTTLRPLMEGAFAQAYTMKTDLGRAARRDEALGELPGVPRGIGSSRGLSRTKRRTV